MSLPRCFQIQPQDNVATLIDQCSLGSITLTGAKSGQIMALETIAAGHKIAMADIAVNQPVIKFGVRIGHAIKPISAGEWVHLHNLASDMDERSGTLDLRSGAPTDMRYE